MGYTYVVLLHCTLVFGFVTWLALKYVRIEPDRQHVKEQINIGKVKEIDKFSIPFTPVNLSFGNLVYDVRSFAC